MTFMALFGVIFTSSTNLGIFQLALPFILTGAWGFYFLIGYQWVKYNAVSKRYKIIAALFCGLSILFLILAPFLLLPAATGILLTIYNLRKSTK